MANTAIKAGVGQACDASPLESLERAQHVLSMLKTLSHTDVKSYIGWTIKNRATNLKAYEVTVSKRKSNKKDKRP
jgi:hypothetical protein